MSMDDELIYHATYRLLCEADGGVQSKIGTQLYPFLSPREVGLRVYPVRMQ